LVDKTDVRLRRACAGRQRETELIESAINGSQTILGRPRFDVLSLRRLEPIDCRGDRTGDERRLRDPFLKNLKGVRCSLQLKMSRLAQLTELPLNLGKMLRRGRVGWVSVRRVAW